MAQIDEEHFGNAVGTSPGNSNSRRRVKDLPQCAQRSSLNITTLPPSFNLDRKPAISAQIQTIHLFLQKQGRTALQGWPYLMNCIHTLYDERAPKSG